MPRKGKKKKHNTAENTASTSTAVSTAAAASTSTAVSTSTAASTSEVVSTSAGASSKQTSLQQQKQKQTSQQQQQDILPSTLQQPQQQIAWGPRQQQQVSQDPPQQQQVPPGISQQPQQRAARGRGQQQHGPPPQQQQQVSQGPPQQQQVPPGISQQPQQRAAWGPRQQQQVSQGPPQQQQVPPGVSQQPQQRAARGRGQQQHGPPPQQQQQVSQGPPQQQQVPPGISQQPQQRAAWGPRQQQQVSQGPPQQQQVPPGVSQQPQQRAAWGPRQQQQGPPPQQRQQVPPDASQQPQQRAAWGPQQQQPGPPQQQQQVPGTLQWPQQPVAWAQQQQKAWGPQQQIPQSPQQVPQSLPQQQQPQQAAWGPRQQVPPGLSQQKQGTQVDIGGSGDNQQSHVLRRGNVGDSDVKKKQPTTSVSSSELSQLTLRDPLESTKVPSKAKMTSSAMKQYQLSIPKRQNPLKGGTLGKHIRVFTNMFEIIFDKKFVTNAVHYDVNITPIASKILYRRVFEECRRIHFGNRYPAFDGKKNVYSANNLPFNDYMETEIEMYDGERDKERKFKITLNKVANIDLSWIKNLRPGLDEADRDQTGIQALDIIMRHAPESRYLSIGRSLFWTIDDSEPLGGGLSLSRGGFQSAVLGWKPYLNVDVAHKGFPTSQNVIDLMKEFTKYPPTANLVNKGSNRDKIEKYLKGLKVNYQIPNQPRTKRTYRVNGLGPSATHHRFECDGSMITIVEYFKRCKSYNLRYPDLPCLWVGAINREEKIYLPAELCVIVSCQSVNRKLDDEQTTSMIKKAATDAPTRRERINNAFAMIDVNNSDTMEQEFHLSVDAHMKQVDARILPPPELKYAVRTVRVTRGTWQLQQFNQARDLEQNTWTIFDCSGTVQARAAHDFKESLITIGKEVGMNIKPPLTPFTLVNTRSQRDILRHFEKGHGLKLIIVIVPDHTDAIYSTVKQITELSLGILTQCVKARTVIKNNAATVKNILLKINSKLNGINHTFNIMPTCLRDNVCMLVGADVTHPSPDAVNIPSIAAVAASSDTSAFQYNIALRLQPPKEEIILDLERIIISQLLIYQRKNSRLPKRIIYYRDGVSEGQLAQVMHFEIAAIKRACKSCKADIQITCLVVQKRHHVRLFPSDPLETDDRNKNVKAGTIVDTEITHPNHIDFYLVSHASIQGTARPTKYRCICNESNYTENQIEELTYYLCHIYARCTRAVSYPAPTYYAHLGAYRGRALIHGVDICLDQLEKEQHKLQMKMAESPMCFI